MPCMCVQKHTEGGIAGAVEEGKGGKGSGGSSQPVWQRREGGEGQGRPCNVKEAERDEMREMDGLERQEQAWGEREKENMRS